MAFLGYPRGNRIDPETRCSMQHTVPNERMDTLPRTRASQNRLATHEVGRPRRATGVLCNAQAACVFSCSASKRSSFFQSIKAMAAIFRASVRRAISGFMPLSSKAT